MGFLKSVIGMMAVLACLVAVGAVIWFCLEKNVHPSEPDGTLVLAQEMTIDAFARTADAVIPAFVNVGVNL